MVCGMDDPKANKIKNLTNLLLGGFKLDYIMRDLTHLKDIGSHEIPEEKIKPAYQEIMDMLAKKNTEDSLLMNSLMNLRDNKQMPACAIDYVYHKLRQFDSIHYFGKTTELLLNP